MKKKYIKYYNREVCELMLKTIIFVLFIKEVIEKDYTGTFLLMIGLITLAFIMGDINRREKEVKKK